MKVEREFFLPYIAGQLGNSLERAEQLQRKVEEFVPVAKVLTVVSVSLYTAKL